MNMYGKFMFFVLRRASPCATQGVRESLYAIDTALMVPSTERALLSNVCVVVS